MPNLPALSSDCLRAGRRNPGRIDPDSALTAGEVRRDDVVFDEGFDGKDEVSRMLFVVYLHHEQHHAVAGVEWADGPGLGTAPQCDELTELGRRRLGALVAWRLVDVVGVVSLSLLLSVLSLTTAA